VSVSIVRYHLPDEGIWEVRGPHRHFVSSKVMAWVALDRAVRDAEQFGFPAPLTRWRALREEIHREVLVDGYDADRGTFTQSYGSKALDASALLFPLVGFLPAGDDRMDRTVAAIEHELSRDEASRTHSEPFAGCVAGVTDPLAALGQR
jgi:GH15 family glucan-1,4-alpha-glucosidase